MTTKESLTFAVKKRLCNLPFPSCRSGDAAGDTPVCGDAHEARGDDEDEGDAEDDGELEDGELTDNATDGEREASEAADEVHWLFMPWACSCAR